MTIQPSPGQPPEPQQMLFTAGPRLGWTYTDHRTLIARHPEPPPDLQALQQEAATRLTAAQRSWQRALKWALRPSLMIFVALLALGGCAHALNPAAPFGTTVLSAVILALPGTGWTIWRYAQLRLAKDVDPQRQYQAMYEGWQQRAAAHERAGLAQLAGVPEWGSAGSPSRRTDVFGGTLAGWRCLLTVHGASLLAERPLLVADLSGQDAAADLAGLARYAQVPVAEYALPGDLGRCGLLAGLGPKQLAEALADAIHTGAAGATRTDRAVDLRVLERLASAIGQGGITPARLAAAAEAALGRDPGPGLLTADEEALISGQLFGETYLPQIGANLVRLDAFLSDLAAHAGPGTPQVPAAAPCTILAAGPGARSAHGEVLASLIITWLTAQAPGGAAIIVAGADEIPGYQLERLADTCDSCGVPLTLLFRHLRNDATALIGGGATAFMRLGNHTEAEQAATFIGRKHTFVLSALTATHGGDQSITRGQTQTWGQGESRGFNSSRGWSRDHLLGGGSTTGSSGRTRDYSRNYSWAEEFSHSDGTNWSNASTRERVYEFAVEPTVLQRLPVTALLLVGHNGQVQPVECHPALARLPQTSTTPQQAMPVHPPETTGPPMDPQPAEAEIGPGRYQPEWTPEPQEEARPTWPPQQPPDPRTWR